MYLMRIGTSGAEKPVARLDDERYVDRSDVVGDFDESFFGSGGIDRVRPVVAERPPPGRCPASPANASVLPSPARTRSCASG